MDTVREVIAAGALRSVLQPIVDLASGAVVGYEALARGPVGPLERPDALFARARAEGLLAELDAACRRNALAAASRQGIVRPLAIFVNVEPEVVDAAPLDELLTISEQTPRGLRVVVEMTERSLAARPAELLRTVQQIRRAGWEIAIDDVGADPASLAFMPLLRPDVVKLDLSLVQRRPSADIAQIMNAVNAYAEHTGAQVLAEGIETPEHVLMAQALGAQLGQGWHYGRPAEHRDRSVPMGSLRSTGAPPAQLTGSPFDCLPVDAEPRIAPKRLLIELSKQLEREALRIGDTCIVAATFQYARHFTPDTRRRYHLLAEQTAFVCALGAGLTTEPLPGLRGASLDADDPILGEWSITVVAPHFAVALLARDLHDEGPDDDRRFEYSITYQRDAVVRATNVLLSRVIPVASERGDRNLQLTG